MIKAITSQRDPKCSGWDTGTLKMQTGWDTETPKMRTIQDTGTLRDTKNADKLGHRDIKMGK